MIYSILFGAIAFVAYLIATTMIVRSIFIAPIEHNPPILTAYLLPAWIAVIAHTVMLTDSLWNDAGINFSLPGTAALIILIIVLILLITAANKPVEKLGLLIFPLAATFLVLTLVFPQQSQPPPTSSVGMQTHIFSSIIAFSILNIAAIQAILLAVQDHQLHHHKSNRFIRSMPSLQTMESLLFQMIGAGLVLLTCSLVSGSMFIENLFEQHLAHKTILSILAWILFCVLLWGRTRHGWRGKIAIRWTLGGFASLMLAYFGSRMVLEIILHRT